MCLVLVVLLLLAAGGASGQWTFRADSGGGDGTVPPAAWGTYSPACQSGERQSPIDLALVPIDWNLRPLQPLWAALEEYELVLTPGRAVRLVPRGRQLALVDRSADATAGDARGGAESEYLLDFVDFASPSMHTFGGAHRDLEIMFVHTSRAARNVSASQAPPRYVVSATLMAARGTSVNYVLRTLLHRVGETETAARNLASARARFAAAVAAGEGGTTERRDALLDTIGSHREVFHRQLDLTALLPPSRDYYTYAGSMPRPPCEESVTWAVLAQPGVMGEQQLVALRRLIGLDTPTGATDASLPPSGNNRPLLHVPLRPPPAAVRDDGTRETVRGEALDGQPRELTLAEIRGVTRFSDALGDARLLHAPERNELNRRAADVASAALGLGATAFAIAAVAFRIAGA